MSYYQKHVFVCNNQKLPGKKCCAAAGAEEAFTYIKEKLMALEKHGPDKIRISKSGCLGRCAKGPCVVVYPEGVWYSFANQSDLDEIIERHLLNDERVSHLTIENF